jgi:hypothetical protein
MTALSNQTITAQYERHSPICSIYFQHLIPERLMDLSRIPNADTQSSNRRAMFYYGPETNMKSLQDCRIGRENSIEKKNVDTIPQACQARLVMKLLQRRLSKKLTQRDSRISH